MPRLPRDGCRDPCALKRVAVIRAITKGTTVQSVLQPACQSHTRLATTFGYCAKDVKGKKVSLTVLFTEGRWQGHQETRGRIGAARALTPTCLL